MGQSGQLIALPDLGSLTFWTQTCGHCLPKEFVKAKNPHFFPHPLNTACYSTSTLFAPSFFFSFFFFLLHTYMFVCLFFLSWHTHMIAHAKEATLLFIPTIMLLKHRMYLTWHFPNYDHYYFFIPFPFVLFCLNLCFFIRLHHLQLRSRQTFVLRLK